MTIKETLNTIGKIVVSSILSAGILFTIYSFTKKDTADIRMQDEIDEKADISYVDDQDYGLTEDLKAYKTEHQKQHDATQNLLLSMDRKIDILLDNR